MFSIRSTLSFLLIIGTPVVAQKLKKADKVVISNLEAHVRYLADDRLEGRRAGSNGERLAMEYIKGQFEKNGLIPKGDSGSFYQPFNIPDGRSLSKSSYLFINGEEIAKNNYFPAPFSSESTLSASPSIALKEAGVPWFLDIKEDMQGAKNNPHFNLLTFLADKAKDASKKGATALFIYNSDRNAEALPVDAGKRSSPADIPVVMIASTVAIQYFTDETATLAIRLNIGFSENVRTGHNVIGYIDNKAATTVILGAHFDHLGFGEDGGSLSGAGTKLIHNGADDNASGIAALIELSGRLKTAKLKNNNYLFTAFSGEELGLFGSRYFVDHPTINLTAASYMLNMDMVGRLNDSTKVLTIGGYGTSPTWAQVFKNIGSKSYFISKFDSSGTGPSDHTSFYRKNIPVLFFFTGWHSDYHKPTDDADKVNYTGEYRIVQYIYSIIEAANKSGKPAFTKTTEQPTGASARFTVTLGIMPDYGFTGEGVRVDAVSEGRPAGQAGLKSGDVVVQLGDYPVTSLETYMQALNKFRTGDKTMVKIKRAGQIITAAIAF